MPDVTRKYKLTLISPRTKVVYEAGSPECPSCEWRRVRGLNTPAVASERERAFLYKIMKAFEEYEGDRPEHVEAEPALRKL